MARPKKTESPSKAPAAATPDAAPPPGAIRTLPLFSLVLSGLNVRQTERDADVAALAEDIAARGLKQNLVVVPAHFMTAETEDNFGDKFEVIAGGRRFQALRLLAEAGRIEPDYAVPVLVDARDEARETSLSENLHRVAMNPADEFEAFHQIASQADANSDPDPAAYVAKRFGVTRRHVEGRLRLASLAPEILEALRSGDLTVDSAKAYAGTEDHDRQLKVFKAQIKSSWNKHDPRTVRDALRGASLSLGDGRVKFVGIEAYRAAGAATETEMFMGTDGEERLTDLALLDRLCAEQAEPLLAAQAEADGYASGLFAPGCGHSYRSPKVPDGFEKHGYEHTSPAPEVKKQRIGIYTVAYDGSGLEARDSYKPIEADKPKQSGYVPETPEQRAARERQNLIDVWAARLAIGRLAGTPLEGKVFWPTNVWHSVEDQFPPNYDPDSDNEDADPAPIAALVSVRIRVTAEAIEAQRTAAEAKVDQILAEEAERAAQLKAEREAAAARREAASTDDDDEDDLETEEQA